MYFRRRRKNVVYVPFLTSRESPVLPQLNSKLIFHSSSSVSNTRAVLYTQPPKHPNPAASHLPTSTPVQLPLPGLPTPLLPTWSSGCSPQPPDGPLLKRLFIPLRIKHSSSPGLQVLQDPGPSCSQPHRSSFCFSNRPRSSCLRAFAHAAPAAGDTLFLPF